MRQTFRYPRTCEFNSRAISTRPRSKDGLRVQYLGPEKAAGSEPPLKLEFTTEYRAATRVLEIRFSQPLERFRTLQVDLPEGVLGTDQQPLRPWTLTFMTGGS